MKTSNIWEFIKEMFSAKSGQISSKRVMGVLGMLVIFGTYVYCAVSEHEMPGETDAILIAVTTLLGVDSVTGAFKKGGEV